MSARRGLDRWEAALLLVFASISLWVLGLDLWRQARTGLVWTGGDGLYPVDQLQYMAWVQSAAQSGLVANLFVLHRTAADYLQPAIQLSALLTAAGVPAWIALLLWKPLAVGGSFAAMRAFGTRSLPSPSGRRVALTLALFGGIPTLLYGSLSAIGDLYPGFLAWGYTFALLALASMIGALLLFDQAAGADRRAAAAGLLGALASWLHPWNGELLIIALWLGSAILWSSRRPGRPAASALLLATALTAAPLVYYALLGRLDPSWGMAREASKHAFPLLAILLTLAPLIAGALPAWRVGPGFLSAATRAWPLGALLLYAISGSSVGATPLHAFQGITLPLGVMAVQGWKRLRLPAPRWALAVLLAGLTLPLAAEQLSIAARLAAPLAGDANFIHASERDALAYLARTRAPGGVLARSYLGVLVPGRTGRHTFVGDCLWSEPGCGRRLAAVRALFGGTMGPAAARRFVRATGTSFLLGDCRGGANLPQLLGPLTASVHRFGCAEVVAVRAPGT